MMDIESFATKHQQCYRTRIRLSIWGVSSTIRQGDPLVRSFERPTRESGRRPIRASSGRVTLYREGIAFSIPAKEVPLTSTNRGIAGKGKYGIDAPGVVRNLALIGLALLLASAVGIIWSDGIVWLVLSRILLLGALSCLAEAAWMIWSSTRGKASAVEALLAPLRLRPEAVALDVGCGRGFVLHSMALRLDGGGRAVGIDIWNAADQSGNGPEAARRNAEAEGVADRVDLVHADARALPFAADTFDAVASCLAIHNIPEPSGRRQALGEIVRVLKPNGQVAILDFQHTEQYALALSQAGLVDVTRSKPLLAMFPPVRIVTGRKP